MNQENGDNGNGSGPVGGMRPAEPVRSLTPRELEILRLVSKGNGARQTGEILGISPFTVRRHIVALRLKLQARTMPQAVSIASQLGLLVTVE